MTYDARERSAFDGRPVELYTFNRDYQAYRYTSADRDIEVSSQTYAARAISRSAIEQSSEVARASLKVTAQRDLEVADLFRVSPPTFPITFTLQQFHEADSEVVTLWTGRIATVEWVGASCEITLEPVYTALKRVGLRRLYQRQCPHALYGTACRKNREVMRVDATADGITGVTLTSSGAAAKPNGYFAGGYVEYETDIGIFERRFISDQIGAALSLNTSPAGLAVGQAVKLYPGCSHTLEDCVNKFENAENYGGFPYFTQKNPFGGDPIF